MAKKMIIEKSVTINKPVNEVFDYLKITRNQEEFSVWNMKDPEKNTSSRERNRRNCRLYLHLG